MYWFSSQKIQNITRLVGIQVLLQDIQGGLIEFLYFN